MNKNLKKLICAERYKICICNSAIIGFDSSIPNLQYKNFPLKYQIIIKNEYEYKFLQFSYYHMNKNIHI